MNQESWVGQGIIETGFAVPSVESARDANVEEVSSKLSEGLETCRAVIEDYRLMLAGQSTSGTGSVGHEIPSNENDPWGDQLDADEA